MVARKHWLAAAMLLTACTFTWTPTFFGAHQITLALAILLALDLAVVDTTWLFFRVRRLAGWLMLPYLAWVLFATLLNWQFLQLNPGADGREVSGSVQRIEL